MAHQEQLIIQENHNLPEHIYKSPDELPFLPNSPEFTPHSEHSSYLGDMALTRAGWGGQLSTENYIAARAAKAELTQLQIDQIRNVGFDGGYRFHPSVENIFDPHLQMLQAGWAANLALKTIEMRGWDTVDALYVGSSTVATDTIPLVQDLIEQLGVKVNRIQQHSLACQSWSTATIDALLDPTLQGKNVIVVGLDTLSPMTDPYDTTDPDSPITYQIFGNGGGAWAFKPGEEIQHLHGVTQFEHDEEGLTRCIPICSLPPQEEWLPYPPHFSLKNEKTKDFLAYTKNGLIMYLPPTGNGKIIMNGRGTYSYFIIESHSFDLIEQEVSWYNQHINSAGMFPLDTPFGHEPSYEVISGLNKHVRKQWARKKLEGDPPQFPWVMRQTKFNNISAGTGLVAMEQMTHEGLLKPHSSHLLLGLGIGSSIGVTSVHFS